MLNEDPPKNYNQSENLTSNLSLEEPSKNFSHPSPLSTEDDGAFQYIYVTDVLSSNKQLYTTVWDDLFENIKAPMCNDMSSYLFNPFKPLLPFGSFEDVSNLIGLSPLSGNNIDSPNLLSSSPIVVGDIDNLVFVDPPPSLPYTTNYEVGSTSRALDASESDALTMPLEAVQNTNETPSTGIQHEATTTHVELMSQFSSLATEGEILMTPTIIRVGHEEDVAEKVTTFAKENRFVCISGVSGSLSLIQIRGQEGVVTFQGHFDIITLGGYLAAPENDGDPMTGQLFITFVGSDGQVFGGVVHGRLIPQFDVQINAYSL